MEIVLEKEYKNSTCSANSRDSKSLQRVCIFQQLAARVLEDRRKGKNVVAIGTHNCFLEESGYQ